MSETILVTLVSAITALLSSAVTHNMTKKKFKADVNSVEIENLLKKLEFYEKLVQDYKNQLDSYISTAEETRLEMLRLKGAVTNLIYKVCKYDKCNKRQMLQDKEIREIILPNNQEGDK